MTEMKPARKPMIRWTDSELTYLKTNAHKGAKVLAAELGRSEQLVRAKATRLGLSLRMEGSTRGRRSKSETTQSVSA